MPLERTKHVNGRMWQPGPSGNPNGRPSRLSGCPKFSGATSRRETLSRSRRRFPRLLGGMGRSLFPAWLLRFRSLQWTGWVVGRRVLLRARAACHGPGVAAWGHVTALDPPCGPYPRREVSAAAAGSVREAGPKRRAHPLLLRSRAIARGLRRQPYLLRRHPLPSRAAA